MNRTKYIALTFDDGPNNTTTIEVLEKLQRYNVVASFFVIGCNINENTAKVMVRAKEMGCEIHNHSNTNPHMTQLSRREICDELDTTSELIYKYVGEYPKFFRPPYLEMNDELYAITPNPVIGGIGAKDWMEEVTSKERADMIIHSIKEGDIILLHDFEGNRNTVEALELIIPTLKLQGYEFVTVTKLFHIYNNGDNHTCGDKKDRMYHNVIQ